MHNSLKRAVSIAIAAIALFSLPCGSIFARTHIDIDKKCSITVDIPDTWEDLYTVDFPVVNLSSPCILTVVLLP